MANTWAVFLIAAVLAAATAFWVLRAYRTSNEGAPAAPALIACLFIAVGALGLYLIIGRPDLPDAAFASRLAALKHRDPTTFTVDETLAVLGEAAKARPNDATPHLFQGQLLLQRDRPDQAARAFDAALRRDPQSVEAMLGLGRALVGIDEGRVSPQALSLFQTAAARSDDPVPWIYQAMAAMQDNRAADARRFWGEALSRMDPNDPRRAMARRMSAG